MASSEEIAFTPAYTDADVRKNVLATEKAELYDGDVDWKAVPKEILGELVLYDMLSIRRRGMRVGEFAVYLFEKELLFFAQEKPPPPSKINRIFGRFKRGSSSSKKKTVTAEEALSSDSASSLEATPSSQQPPVPKPRLIMEGGMWMAYCSGARDASSAQGRPSVTVDLDPHFTPDNDSGREVVLLFGDDAASKQWKTELDRVIKAARIAELCSHGIARKDCAACR